MTQTSSQLYRRYSVRLLQALKPQYHYRDLVRKLNLQITVVNRYVRGAVCHRSHVLKR